MDGLNFEAARRFQRAGEQLTCRHPQARVGSRDTGLDYRCIERRVIERDPMAKCGEHPLRHVGGGGFREGDAQDPFRRYPVEQQSDHPLHQDVRLA